MLTPNASPLEIAWTVLAVLGIGFGVAFEVLVWLSYRAVTSWIERGWAIRWGPRHKFVIGFLIGVALLICVWVGFAMLGVNAALNPPPATPDRQAASDRGGWILVGLEAILLMFSGLLLWVWLAIGRPRMSDDHPAPTITDLLEASTQAGRDIAHVVADDLQMPVYTLDVFSRDPRLPEDVRQASGEALVHLDSVMTRVRALHAEIKHLGGTA